MSDIHPPITKSKEYPARVITWLKATLFSTRRGIQDVAVSMVPQGVQLVTGLITSVLVARGLGPAGLGQYALVVSLSGTAAQLSDLGIGQTAIRFASRAVAQGRSEGQLAILRWAFRLRFFMVLLICTFLFALAPTLAEDLWGTASLTPLIRLGLLIPVFSVLASIPMIYFQSLKRFGMNATVLSGQTLMLFGGIVLLAWLNRWSVSLVIAVSLVATGIGALVFLILVPRKAFFVPGELTRILKASPRTFFRSPTTSHVELDGLDDTSPDRFAAFMLLASVLVMLTLRADVWLMGIFLDDSQIGIYHVATRFTLPLVVLLNALNTALWPRASALADAETTLKLLRKTFRLSTLAAGIGVAYAIVVPLLAPWLFGKQYAESTLLGQFLCIRYCFSLLICPIGVIGYSFGMVRVYWIINLLQLAAVVGVNFWLLPVYGPLGSAIALIINDVLGLILTGALLGRRIRHLGVH